MSRAGSRRSWYVIGGVVVLALFGPGVYQWVALSLRQRQLDRQLASLTARHQQLADQQQRLQSDSAYLEGLIRSTFKVSQPGEYVIPLDSRNSASTKR